MFLNQFCQTKINFLIWPIPLAAVIYSLIIAPYPYFAAWDSSLIYAVDALIAGAGQLPDHIFHPNITPLLINKYLSLPLGKFFGLISISSITELALTSNPYLAFVEVVNYLLFVNIIFVLVFLFCMYLSVFELIKPYLQNQGYENSLNSITVALLALVWANLPFMLYWIRYETVGIALWSVALFLIIKAAQEPSRIRLIVLAGLFSGFAFLSKLHLIGGIIPLPFLYCFLLKEQFPKNQPQYKWLSLLILISVFLFIGAVHYLAYTKFINHKLIMVAFSDYLTPQQFYYPLILILIGTFICFISACLLISRLQKTCGAPVFYLSAFISPFFFSLLLAIFIGTSWTERVSSLSFGYIYSFMLGQSTFIKAIGYSPAWQSHTTLFSIFILLIIFLLILWKFTKNQLIFYIFLFGVLTVTTFTVSITFLLRPEPLKDGLMQEAWSLISGITVWILLSKIISSKKVYFVGLFVAWALISFNSYCLYNYHKSNFEQGDYYYSLPQWKEFSYGLRGNQYLDILNSAYPSQDSWRSVFDWSTRIAPTNLLLTQSIKNEPVSIGNTYLANIGTILNKKSNEKIAAISPQLTGALLIAPALEQLEITSRSDFNYWLISEDAIKPTEGQIDRVDLIFDTTEKLNLEHYGVYKISSVVTKFVRPPAGRLFIAIKSKLAQ